MEVTGVGEGTIQSTYKELQAEAVRLFSSQMLQRILRCSKLHLVPLCWLISLRSIP